MLPIDHILPDLLATLQHHNTALLQAPPGAGKTTRVPLALLDVPWLAGKRVLMLEPRRLAARNAARFMAAQLGEPPGRTVGYRTRLDSKVSAATRIEVVTEGILTRMIQEDPELAGYGAILFDEFHERSLQADLGLALAREAQQALREDLRLLIMSATLDAAPLAALLEDAPLLTSEGRAWPVAVHYRPQPRERKLPEQVVSVVLEALADHPGSLLVFLPGAGEIRKVASLLSSRVPADTLIAPLYGNLDTAAQDQAIKPAPPGQRKIVLATAIAETSLTIDGVRVVIDSGLQRRARFDPNSGMTRLVTGRLSRAAAEQRKGRAGRLEPGVCYRLWSESDQFSLAEHTPAEILEADLAPLVLELARWGCRDPVTLTWLDAPPPAHWQQAVSLLQWLELLDQDGAITAQGQQALALGLHPRLAHMVLRGRALGAGHLAAELAALLEERDLLGPTVGVDLHYRLQALRGEYRSPRLDQARLTLLRKMVARLGSSATAAAPASVSPGCLLAFAYPDRIAKRRPGHAPRYQLSNGRGASLSDEDRLSQSPWLVAAELDGQSREARVFLAAEISEHELRQHLAGHISSTDEASWDDDRGTLVARQVTRLGALVLEEKPLAQPDPALIQQGLLAAVRKRGLASLPWTEEARQWQARVALLQQKMPEQWPDVSPAALLASLEHWLGPYLPGVRNWAGLQKVNLLQALTSLLDYPRQQQLEQLAPARLAIPTGQTVALDYTAEQGPVLATKLQTLFGLTETPRIAGGQVPVVIHLLSPAQRPLAVTSDLASFWRNAYSDVRKDMRGRYPKHPWPEDPLTALPKQGTKKSGR
ncbi:MAG: ATP-dependent helicase HrpB [Marinobacter sp.]|nr:ATP-dependent helicase HrpB [Marinobacter sp.]